MSNQIKKIYDVGPKWKVELRIIESAKGAFRVAKPFYCSTPQKGAYAGRTFQNCDIASFENADEFLAACQLAAQLAKEETQPIAQNEQNEPPAKESGILAPSDLADDDIPF